MIETTSNLISVDLGGTRVRAARLDYDLNMLDRQETLTLASEGFEPVMSRIKTMIRAVWPNDGATVTGIGIAAPGPIAPATGAVVHAENLPGWSNVPLANLLTDAFQVPVFVNNDANAAALGETVAGAAQGCRDVIYLTLSTGIGGGFITDGKLLLGHDGMAAEAGFLYLVIDGEPFIWQDKASGLALAEEARRRAQAQPDSLVWTLAQGDSAKIDSVLIGEAARQSDPLAQDLLHHEGFLIGLGIASLVHQFNPEIVVLGGGLTGLGDLLLTPMHETLSKYTVPAFLESLRVVTAALKGDAGIIGAAASVLTAGGYTDVVEVSKHLRRHSARNSSIANP